MLFLPFRVGILLYAKTSHVLHIMYYEIYIILDLEMHEFLL